MALGFAFLFFIFTGLKGLYAFKKRTKKEPPIKVAPIVRLKRYIINEIV